MAADCLTKPMSDAFLQGILDSGLWCVKQPELGKMQKEKKASQRSAKRAMKRRETGEDSAGTEEPAPSEEDL